MEEDAFLLALMTHLTSPENAMQQEHPAYLESLLQLIACNSAWVATAPQVRPPLRDVWCPGAYCWTGMRRRLLPLPQE